MPIIITQFPISKYLSLWSNRRDSISILSSLWNSLNTSNDFRLVFHLVNTLIYLNPQWSLQNNDIHYMLKYYTSSCMIYIFNYFMYTPFYHVEIIMYDTQQFGCTFSVSTKHGVLVISSNEAWFTCVKRSSIQTQHVSSKWNYYTHMTKW